MELRSEDFKTFITTITIIRSGIMVSKSYAIVTGIGHKVIYCYTGIISPSLLSSIN
jgi:hypothetical protein